MNHDGMLNFSTLRDGFLKSVMGNLESAEEVRRCQGEEVRVASVEGEGHGWVVHPRVRWARVRWAVGETSRCSAGVGDVRGRRGVRQVRVR